MKTNEIKFTITLDDNKVPEKIDWSASDTDTHNSSKSIMIAVWDAQKHNTLRIDLWTKDMMVDEMKQFYHQCLLTMADSFERATGEASTAKAMRNFAQEFGQRMNLVMKNPLTDIGKRG